MEFSDYIVFADESGDHNLKSLDPDFPAFALSFCVFKKEDYCSKVAPSVQALKFRFWGHDAVVLHEHEIRKSKGPFTLLMSDKGLREDFYKSLNEVMSAAPMTIIASAIHKQKLIDQYTNPYSPYEIALKFCLERLLIFLKAAGEVDKRVHIVFECRGSKEDSELELAFRRVIAGDDRWGWVQRDFSEMDFQPVFAKKAANSSGLQFADLTARPIALKMLRPTQDNRAYDIIQTKLGDIKQFP